jgi:hypothetical protein
MFVNITEFEWNEVIIPLFKVKKIVILDYGNCNLPQAEPEAVIS